MDVQMPEMDSIQTTRAIRADGRWATTAHAVCDDRMPVPAPRMDDYVAKPLRAADLLAAIQRQADR